VNTTRSTGADKTPALTQLLHALCDAVAASGNNGVPGGVLYANPMAAGSSLRQFQSLMDLLVDTGRIRRQEHLYYASEPGGQEQIPPSGK
jgi:hypothetical protein